jgi:hypothetical protein
LDLSINLAFFAILGGKSVISHIGSSVRVGPIRVHPVLSEVEKMPFAFRGKSVISHK